MHVLISITTAVLMQTPGVHYSALDAALRLEKPAVSQGAGALSAQRLERGGTCLCPVHRRVS